MSSQIVTPWSDERIAELTKLWEEGYSAGVIAEKFGVTRNSVIGKVFRLGLPAPETKVVKAHPRKSLVKKPKPEPTRLFRLFAPDMYQPRCIEIEPLNLTTIEIDLGTQCQYIAGDDGLHCGHLVQDKSSYCPKHHALCHEPTRFPVYRFARAAA
jgi:GcrA cell cycle regulator